MSPATAPHTAPIFESSRWRRLAALELRYEGPIPPDLLSALASGDGEAAAARRNLGLSRLHDALAAEARTALALRRRVVAGRLAPSDRWLLRLEAGLAAHRAMAVALAADTGGERMR